MIVERVEHPQWTSNAYLVSDGTHGFIVDSNGVEDPLAQIVDDKGIELTHVLVTHSDMDHVVNPERWGVPVVTSTAVGTMSECWGTRSTSSKVRAVAMADSIGSRVGGSG